MERVVCGLPCVVGVCVGLLLWFRVCFAFLHVNSQGPPNLHLVKKVYISTLISYITIDPEITKPDTPLKKLYGLDLRFALTMAWALYQSEVSPSTAAHLPMHVGANQTV